MKVIMLNFRVVVIQLFRILEAVCEAFEMYF